MTDTNKSLRFQVFRTMNIKHLSSLMLMLLVLSISISHIIEKNYIKQTKIDREQTKESYIFNKYRTDAKFPDIFSFFNFVRPFFNFFNKIKIG